MKAVVTDRRSDAMASARARRRWDMRTALRSLVCCVRRATVSRSSSALLTRRLVTRLMIEVRMIQLTTQQTMTIAIFNGAPTNV